MAKAPTNIKDFKPGDKICGMYKDGNVFTDAEVKEWESTGKTYIVYGNDIKFTHYYLENFKWLMPFKGESDAN